MISKVRPTFCMVAIISMTCAVLYAQLDVDELPDLTGGLIPLLVPTQTFGSGGELFSGGRISSLQGDAVYEVRVKNQSGDPVEADSIVVVVHRIQEASRLRDVTTSLVEVVDPDGFTKDGRPYFYVPMGGRSELEPYAESDAFTLEILNPNLLRLYPPVLRVRGIRRTASQAFQKTLQDLVDKGALSPEEAQEALESSSE